MSDEKSRLLAEAAARLPSGLHAHLEKIAGPLSVERDELGTWLTSARLQERIWVPEAEPLTAHAPAPAGTAPHACGTSQLVASRGMGTRTLSDQGLIHWRSKYPIGNVVVHVTFLQGPKVNWANNQASRITTVMQAVSNACTRIGSLIRNDGGPWPSPKLYAVMRPGGIVTGPNDNLHDWNVLAPAIKTFLAGEGLFRGPMDEARQDAYRQAYYDHERRLLSTHRAHWCINLFAAPVNNASYATARTDEGFVLLCENNAGADLENTALHEMLHCFGAGDEYASSGCYAGPWGLYQLDNSNCGTPEGELRCMMGDFNKPAFTGRDRICQKTAHQMALIPDPRGAFKPQYDRVQHGYQLADTHFQQEAGTYLLHDVVRAGGQVEVSVSGEAKMNGAYWPHPPEGDTGVAGGTNHLMPGLAVGCVIARWCSVDGSATSPWFYVGSGGTFQAPWDAYLQINVNDQRGWFRDNFGSMSVTLTTRLPDNLGKDWVERLGVAQAARLYASTFTLRAPEALDSLQGGRIP